MSATLHLERPSHLADAVWPYRIVLDGQSAGAIRNGESTQIQTSAGTHTLQLRSLHGINRHLGLASPLTTFEVGDSDTVVFACHPRPFTQALRCWIKCLIGDRRQWITVERLTPVVPKT